MVPNRLGLIELCQRFADEQWVAEHMTPDQAAASVLDQFRRALSAEVEMLRRGPLRRAGGRWDESRARRKSTNQSEPDRGDTDPVRL